MKYILILYMCSLTTGQCPSHHYSNYQFDNHYDCVVAGYGVAQQTFKNLEKMEEFEREYIENNKIAIKFDCKGIKLDEKEFKEKNDTKEHSVKS